MIGIDTNVLLRFLFDDDADQGVVARRFMAERTAADPAYIGAVVLAETIWFLLQRLEYPRPQVLEMVGLLIRSAEVVVEHAEALRFLLNDDSRSIADIPDHLIVWSASKSGCPITVTFDKKAASRVPGMELLA